ncbi:MAG: O-antigen ligase family protein [Patescibacteria group bacterium]
MKSNQPDKFSLAGILTAIFVLVLPFVNSRQLFFGAVNSKYLYIFGFIALIALVFGVKVILRQSQIIFSKRWLLLIFGLVLFIHYLSAVWGVFPIRSFWSDIIRSSGLIFLTGIALIAWLLSELLTARDWQLLRWAIALSGALLSLFTLFGFAALGNSTFAGAYLSLILTITLIELTRSRVGSKWRKILIGLVVIQLISPLLLNLKGLTNVFVEPAGILGSARASSATVIAVLIYFAGWVLWRRYATQTYQKLFFKLWNGLWLVGLVSAVLLLFVPDSFVQKSYIKESSAARLVVWESGLEAFKERPLLGWGPENFRLAFEKHFDNRLYQDEYLGEIWFDRAHNVIVDTLVSVGLVGVVSIILLATMFIVVVIRARKRGLIGAGEARLLSIIPFAHFLQLQTSFDTVATYALGGLVLGYVLWLEKEQIVRSIGKRYIMVFIALIMFIGSLYMLLTESGRQRSLYKIFSAEKSEDQLALAARALSRPDTESLRLASASMIKGLLKQIAAEKDPAQNLTQIGLKQLTAYETHFKNYLDYEPDDYRIRMNYAHLLVIKTVLGEDRLKDAQAIIQDSYKLSPNNPLTYALDAIIELYGGKVKAAKEKINQAITLNTQVDFSREILVYIEKQEKEFPVITVIKLENL